MLSISKRLSAVRELMVKVVFRFLFKKSYKEVSLLCVDSLQMNTHCKIRKELNYFASATL
jgi:hypothetical protein